MEKETKEQLLIRRVFKEIEHSHFGDHKLLGIYCTPIKFDRQLGDDIADYVQGKNPEYYHKKKREFHAEKKRREAEAEVEKKFTSLDEILEDLISGLPVLEKGFIKDIETEDELIGRLHHGFGTGIRNYYKLWENAELVSTILGREIKTITNEADDACGIILRELWQRLKKE